MCESQAALKSYNYLCFKIIRFEVMKYASRTSNITYSIGHHCPKNTGGRQFPGQSRVGSSRRPVASAFSSCGHGAAHAVVGNGPKPASRAAKKAVPMRP